VVLVHGGGWNAGYRSEFVPMALQLVQRGYAAATISYRLTGEAPYPAAVDDVRAAVRWVRMHATAYGIDPQRIALAGGSAGAQIASLAALTADRRPFDPHARDGAVSSAVQAIVNVDGAADFTIEESRRGGTRRRPSITSGAQCRPSSSSAVPRCASRRGATKCCPG
jgi:acetyl esterase/lipase